jgi:squalene-hopene/tetraprenyl-beta-curcumene cyclase
LFTIRDEKEEGEGQMRNTKKITAILLSLFAVISGFAVVLGSVSADPGVGNELQDAQNARDNGLSWLRTSQIEDGSWSYDLGVTSLCVLAFLNAGYDETDGTVANAMDYILQYVQPDGSISSGTYANYYTSTALLALSSTHNSEYDNIIKNAAQFIIDIQLDDSTPLDNYKVTKDDWRYGGIGYGGDGRPDLSNTQFALMALHAAESSVTELDIPQEVWDNALVFINRCHNNVNYNDQEWVFDTSRPSYNDGGYIYFPTDQGSLAGGTSSYMSMTGAGIWSAILSGLKPTDGQVQSALNWVYESYTWDENVGFGQKALYYSYWTMSRALTIAQIKEIISEDGISHIWFSELSQKLIDLQTDEGYWANTESDWFWENIPEVATSYSLLALETNILSLESQIEIILRPGTRSGADITVFDSDDAILGEVSGNSETQTIKILNPNADTITIELVGKTDSSYTLEVLGSHNEREVAKRTYTGSIEKGEHKKLDLVVTAVEGPVSFFGADELTTSIEGTADSSDSGPNIIIAVAWVATIAVIGIGLIVGIRRKRRK